MLKFAPQKLYVYEKKMAIWPRNGWRKKNEKYYESYIDMIVNREKKTNSREYMNKIYSV